MAGRRGTERDSAAWCGQPSPLLCLVVSSPSCGVCACACPTLQFSIVRFATYYGKTGKCGCAGATRMLVLWRYCVWDGNVFFFFPFMARRFGDCCCLRCLPRDAAMPRAVIPWGAIAGGAVVWIAYPALTPAFKHQVCVCPSCLTDHAPPEQRSHVAHRWDARLSSPLCSYILCCMWDNRGGALVHLPRAGRWRAVGGDAVFFSGCVPAADCRCCRSFSPTLSRQRSTNKV